MKKTVLRDLKDKQGNRYIERYDYEGCSRRCCFSRRGDCYLRDYLGDDVDCQPFTIWNRVDEEGYLLDRDGWRGFMDCPSSLWQRIDSERYLIDQDGNRKKDTKGRDIKF